MSKYKAHQRYRLADNSIVPGSTTITGILGLNTQILINWANRLGLEGKDSTKFRDDKAEIGTLAHLIITEKLQGREADTSDYSKNQIDQAENSALSYYEWAKDKKIEPILIEKQQVSEKYRFGGQLDIYAKVNNLYELIDVKSGSGIYIEHRIQVASYKQLLIENGHRVDKVRILNIPRAESESFKEELVGHLNEYWQIFLNALEIYYLLKKVK